LRDKIFIAMENRNPKSDGAENAGRSGQDSPAASQRALQPTISEDPVLGIPVLSFGDDAPVLTSEEVEEMLSDFP
jgi:hypothetical protein